jgi:hypothetical protein
MRAVVLVEVPGAPIVASALAAPRQSTTKNATSVSHTAGMRIRSI